MKINKDKALKILEAEALAAKDNSQPAPEAWVSRVQELWTLCRLNGRTCIAVLGTACLAKALNLSLDATALKVRLNEPGAYSARTLGHTVLAAHALRLGIDLGVSGREPLNNQPFLREPRVTRELPSKAPEALNLLVDCLEDLNRVKTKKAARLILRAFLRARLKEKHEFEFEALISLVGFAAKVEAFVLEQSEHGKRAQAVVAGLLDVLAPERVRTGRIHDPDRNFPGDVIVLSDDHEIGVLVSLEVRDKPVDATDLYHVAQKALDHKVTKAVCVAVHPKQKELDSAKVVSWAQERGLLLLLYFDWASFLGNVLLWSSLPFEAATRQAYRAILHRLQEVEASREAIESWNLG